MCTNRTKAHQIPILLKSMRLNNFFFLLDICERNCKKLFLFFLLFCRNLGFSVWLMILLIFAFTQHEQRNRRITYQGNHFVTSPDPLVTFVYFDQQTAVVHLICGLKKILLFYLFLYEKKEKFGKRRPKITVLHLCCGILHEIKHTIWTTNEVPRTHLLVQIYNRWKWDQIKKGRTEL